MLLGAYLPKTSSLAKHGLEVQLLALPIISCNSQHFSNYQYLIFL